MAELEKDFVRAQKDLVELVKKLRAQRYLHIVDNPKKFFWLHFLGGMASGVGGAVGATIIFTLIIFLLGKLQWVPIVGNFVTEVIRVVDENLK